MIIDLHNLNDSATDALAELVHDQASQIASNVINSGKGVEYLLANGWNAEAIEEAIASLIDE